MYKPQEDSYLFEEFLKQYLESLDKDQLESVKLLDIGTGSGILVKKALEYLDKDSVLAVDINPKVVESVKQQGINCIKSDLFSSVNEKFDIILFNAPYLPLDKDEPEDSRLETTAGKKGDEIIIKFLSQAKDYLNKNGKIFLLVSSLTPMNRIDKYKPKIKAIKKLFFEQLYILEIDFDNLNNK